MVKSSSDFTFNASVPQRSILGPTLFLLFINDLLDDIVFRLELESYEDDTTLYSCLDEEKGNKEFDHVEMGVTLQHHLRNVVESGEKRLVFFNCKNTQQFHLFDIEILLWSLF